MLEKALASNGQNNKGMTLLEVAMAIGIFAMVVVAFLSLFTNANIGITSSGKRIDATLEAKSLLDKINMTLKDSNKNTLDNIKYAIEAMINHDKCNISDNEEEFYRYDKKIHLLISDITVEFDSDNDEIGPQQVCEIRILNFYDNGKKKVELSIYVPMGEDSNE